MNKRFGGMMAKQSQTVSGLLSTLSDNFAIFSGKAMEGLMPLAKQGVQFLIDRLNDPVHPLHWTGGGQFPDLAIWLIPASAVATSTAASAAPAQDYLIGSDGAVYSPSQLPLAP